MGRKRKPDVWGWGFEMAEALLEGPFTLGLLRPPRMRIRIPRMQRPEPMTVFSLIFLTYFLVVSGVVYDIIIEPPSMGTGQDPVTKAVKPIVFMEGRINGQYIIEGLSSGFLFSLGAFGLILLDLARDVNLDKTNRYLFIGGGVLLVLVSYNLAILFLQIKVPN